MAGWQRQGAAAFPSSASDVAAEAGEGEENEELRTIHKNVRGHRASRACQAPLRPVCQTPRATRVPSPAAHPGRAPSPVRGASHIALTCGSRAPPTLLPPRRQLSCVTHSELPELEVRPTATEASSSRSTPLSSVYDAFALCNSTMGTEALLPPYPQLPAAYSRMEAGLGPFGEPSQPKHVLLAVSVGQRPLLYMRHPGSLPALRSRLSRIFAFAESSLRVSAEVSAPEDRLPPDAEQPRILRIKVGGRPLMSAVDLVFILISWFNLAAACLFAYFTLYLGNAPVPYVYAAPVPLIALYANVRASYDAVAAEFLVNASLRVVLGRSSTEILLLTVFAVLGPETVLLIAALHLFPRRVKLSDECEQVSAAQTRLRRAATTTPAAATAPPPPLRFRCDRMTTR